MANGDFLEGEWTTKEWKEQWTIKVGTAYACSKCDGVAMVTKGGIGMLEPKCCGLDMAVIKGDG